MAAPGKSKLVSDARQAEQRHDWTAALDGWTACLTNFPNDPAALNWRAARATALLNLGRFDNAEAEFLILENQYPQQPAGYKGRARVAAQQRNWVLAAERWSICIDRFPQSQGISNWRSARATALEKAENWRGAHDAWSVVAKTTGDGGAKFHQALCAFKLFGATNDTMSLAQTALTALPGDVRVLKLLSRMASERKDFHEALAWRCKCIAAEPATLEHYDVAMRIVERMGNADFARPIVELAPPELASLTSFRVLVLLRLSRIRGDIEAGLAIISEIPEDTLDLQSAIAIAWFLRLAERQDLLDSFGSRMVARFPEAAGLLALYLGAANHIRGRAYFEARKKELIAPLTSDLKTKVLNGLNPTLLSTCEVKHVVDEALCRGEGKNIDYESLFSLVYRGETEVLEHYILKLDAMEVGDCRLAVLLFKATFEDRKRIARSIQGSVHWQEFERAHNQLDGDIKSLVARGVLSERLQENAQALVRTSASTNCNWLNSAESYYAAASFAGWLQDRIQRHLPTSVLRLGDGEGAFLPYLPSEVGAQESDVRGIQMIWWGKELLTRSQIDTLGKAFYEAVMNADALGLPPPRRLLRTLSSPRHVREGRGLENIIRLFGGGAHEVTSGKVLTSCHIHNDLESWGLYNHILLPARSVSVISCHDLGEFLKSRFDVSVRCQLTIPPEFCAALSFGHGLDSAIEPFYPTVFERIMATVAPEPGEVFLVAAGFLGRLLCDRIRCRGGIGFDIGSIADQWLGHFTRIATSSSPDFDVGSAQIIDQPFRCPPR